jgi:hypothetical protein
MLMYDYYQAWVSGARSWTDAQREAFANDLTRPQLIGVTAGVNRSKGELPLYPYFQQ